MMREEKSLSIEMIRFREKMKLILVIEQLYYVNECFEQTLVYLLLDLSLIYQN